MRRKCVKLKYSMKHKGPPFLFDIPTPRIILWSRWSKMRLDSGIIIIPRIWDHEIIMGLADAEALLDKVFYFVFVRVKLVVVELTNALMYIWIFRFILPASFCPFWFVKLTAGCMQYHTAVQTNTCLLQITNCLHTRSRHLIISRDIVTGARVMSSLLTSNQKSPGQ